MRAAGSPGRRATVPRPPTGAAASVLSSRACTRLGTTATGADKVESTTGERPSTGTARLGAWVITSVSKPTQEET